VFPIDKRISEPKLFVLFRNAAERRLFCTEAAIDRRFGPVLSKKIQLRLLLLGASVNLAMVPTCQPFGLKNVSRGEFTLDLLPASVLRFTAGNGRAQQLSLIKTVTILGVE
jgi:hypothetical protein